MKTGWHSTNPDIDLGLAVLSVVNRGEALSAETIAEACGCHHSRIQQIERQALRKLKTRLRKDQYL